MKKLKDVFWDSLKLTVPFGIVISLLILYGEVNLNSIMMYGLVDVKPVGIQPHNVIHALIAFFFSVGLLFAAIAKRYYIDRDPAPMEVFSHSVISPSSDKRKAQNHPVPEEYLSNQPKGLTIGKYGNRYVTLPYKSSPEHQLILGSPGSHKSSTIINGLIYNYNFASEKERFHAGLIVDCKPELSQKSVDETRDDIKVISPTSFDRFGFNPLYGLNPDSEDDVLGKRCSTIAQAVIANPGGKNGFFYKSAQNILSGRLMYGFRHGVSLGEIVTEMRDLPTEDLITEIMEDASMSEHPKIKKRVRAYEGKDSDAFQDIVMSIQEDLDAFDDDAVIHCFADSNPRRASPEDLVNGVSLFVAIPSNLIFNYAPVFRVLITLCLDHILSIPEWKRKNKRPYWFLIDEAGSIGPIPNLKLALSQGRSFGIMLSIVVQSFAQLIETYGKDGADSILDCCKTTIVTSCNSIMTQRILSEWCGTYRETKLSKSSRGNGFISSSRNENIEYRPIMDVSDIKRLEGTFKALVFVKGDWFLVTKAPYFKIPLLDNKSKEICSANRQFYPDVSD